MVGMDSKNVMNGKVIIILPNKKAGIVDVKNPKTVKTLFINNETIVEKPVKKNNYEKFINLVAMKRPNIKPIFVTPQIATIKPNNNANDVQKSIICFA